MTDRYAVFGNPIAHSQSPYIHRAFAAQTGETLSYSHQLVGIDDFAGAAQAFFERGGRGLNVTVPFKLDAYRFADQLSKAARQASAVNTLITRPDGSIVGDNTDGIGLVRDLRDNLDWPIQRRRVLLLGAGGAVRGVLGPLLAEQPEQLVIANRTAGKALQLATAFSRNGPVLGGGYEILASGSFDLVINGTSASLAGDLPPLPATLLSPGAACYDMMYAPAATVFMRWADDNGAAMAADGLGMLVEQAAESFMLWRQCRPETASVIRALRLRLAG